jgi:hypothetical protein
MLRKFLHNPAIQHHPAWGAMGTLVEALTGVVTGVPKTVAGGDMGGMIGATAGTATGMTTGRCYLPAWFEKAFLRTWHFGGEM